MRGRSWLKQALVLLLLTMWPALSPGAASACSGRLSGPASIDAAYAPFQALDTSKDFALTIQNTGETECIFWLGLERVAAGAATPPLAFDIRGQDGAWSSARAASGTGRSWLASRRLAPNESFDVPLLLAIQAGQLLPPGDDSSAFEAQLHAAAEARAPDSAEPLQSRPLRLSVAIAAHLSVNIAGAGVRKTIDFGDMAGGERKQVRLEARSNQRFQLDVFSRNGGMLAMAAPYEASRVPYAMVLGGKLLNPPETVGPFPGTGLAGSQFDLEFTIGDVLNKRAGLYRDEVTIEIRPSI